MKKSLIPVLLILVAFAGCMSKSGNGTTDSTSVITKPSAPSINLAGPATMSITPPSVVGVAAGNITITSSQPANKIVIAAVFVGTNKAQTVTVNSNADGVTNPIASFTNAPTGGNQFTQVLNGPGANVTYTVTAQVGGAAYTAVGDIPNVNPEPNLVSLYSDGANDTVKVFIMDLGTATP